ncbi:MAG: hypothetical protein COW63_09455 [Bacteroidetes bacterium CG18_big_fil_WC_8_21_14_2_50_41_14]|nr:MAG: hypothetical protein COW63_09455 [Bacteroidetes bacterium CG18_big_fil_WC_8_21_14_2_50_41_14]PJB57756.1 MAG: hypothetical protein CO098_10810 [Bacteroidetes bacterium CG_4_9_14_3_um_filter_41_19]
MADQKDNIELRSEKVRNLIGLIPPVIVRAGISVIFVITLLLLIGSWYFRYEYNIKTIATVSQNTEYLIIILKIPANEISKIKSGQKVILNFNNIPNLYNENIVTEIQTVPNILEVTEDGGFYMVEINLPEKTNTVTGKTLSIRTKTQANAEIVTDKISLLGRITEPVRTLFNKRE